MQSGESGEAARYKVLERLRSEAGVVQVYRAVQTDVGRPVELRLLDTGDLGDRSELLRFEREFRTLATLDHPSLYKVLDWGILGKQVFYVTEWREMRSLAEVAGELGGRLPAEHLFTLGLELGDALAYLHSKGVVHRSLGLEAVLYDPSRRRAAIAEFPMVKDTRLADLTARGVGHLPPALMTPEFLRRQLAAPATDLYLLGALLYRAASGRDPFRREDYVALPEVESATFERLIPPLAEAAPGADVPPELADLVKRCLAFEPAGRPASARRFLADLGEAETAWKARKARRRRDERRTGSSTPAGSGPAVPASIPSPEAPLGPSPRRAVVRAVAAGAVLALASVLWWMAR